MCVPLGRGLILWGLHPIVQPFHSRFYGKTKKGKYVSEADAIKEGDRAAAKGQ